MVNLNELDVLLSARNGVWTLVVLAMVALWRGWTGLPAVMAQWIERRRTIAAEKAADWERLRDEVKRLYELREGDQVRIGLLEAKVEECERREDEWRSRAITAEAEIARHAAIELGLGQARQQAQAAVSADRLEEVERRKKK